MLTAKETNDLLRLATIFNALGDQTRLRLLDLLLSQQSICVSELAEQIGISNAGASQQLKILEHAGLIERRRFGQKICYEVLNRDGVNQQLIGLLQ